MIRLTVAAVMEWRFSFKKKKKKEIESGIFILNAKSCAQRSVTLALAGSMGKRHGGMEMERLARSCMSCGRARAVPSLSRAKGRGSFAFPENW